MNRSRREIKTPKRFDDEPFETPRARPSSTSKQQQQQQQSQQQSDQTQTTPVQETPVKHQTPIKSASESKGIIKVKLTRAKSVTKPQPTPDIPIPSIASSPSTAPSTPSEPQLTPSKSQSPQVTPTAPAPKPASSTSKQPAISKQNAAAQKQSVPSKQSSATSSTKATRPSTTPKPATQKPSSKLQATTSQTKASKGVVRLPDPEIISIPRPKRERPRTPPAYADVIPNVVLPFWDARTAAEDHEDDNVKELVHCHCGIGEELGLMVQCETCLTWQHANCLGIETPEDAPDGYTCKACSDPKFVRESKKWDYDQDWILKGRMKQFPCDLNSIPEENVKTIQKINQLISDTLLIQRLIHSLKVKSKLLANANDDDPELKLFRNQWPASYMHKDGTQFIPSIIQPSSTPTSTISVIGETPDPGDIPVETVVDATLPDIAQLGDVSAILDNTDLGTTAMAPMSLTNHDATPNDCRANLKLHIQQTEEFIGIELSHIQEQLIELEKSCSETHGSNDANVKTSFESLKNDLHSIRNYLTRC